jgi:hypothetical protein
MNAQNKEQSAPATVLKLSKEELRQRILAVVNERGQATTMEIWRADAPNFLPWDSMIEEIKTLDRQKKLRREAVAPGQIVIHSLTAPPVPASPPTAATETIFTTPAPAATPIRKTADKPTRRPAPTGKKQNSQRATKKTK